MDWEKQLGTLGEITQKLKDEHTSLEESISLFEQGVKITKEVEKQLLEAESKIESIINSVDDDKELQTQPFEIEQ
jgi:exodeoxyribonuclease VII small subunit